MSTKVLLHLISLAVLLSVPAFAGDGVVLINQSRVMEAGGFPYKITQPGSYKLSGNLVVNNGVGIEVEADNITLDLNGFTITAPSSIAITNTAVNGSFAIHPGLIVMNGGIVAVAGIQNFGTTTIHDVSISVTGSFGIFITSGKVTASTVISSVSTTQAGISISGGGLVSGNTVSNFNTGISGNGMNVTNNLISGNQVGLAGGFPTGYGSNTFAANNTDVAFGTSMKNNVCSNQSVC